ncbi:TPA: hypothetical protein ACRTNB_001868 [Aeromonas hydrophila]
MEDDLTWLARNVTDSHMCDWYIKVADGYSSMTGGTPTGMSGTWCSRKQIIQRRAELQNKPRFADHPDAKCFFQHESGRWFKNVESSDMGVDGIGWRNNQLSHRIDCGWVDIGLGEVIGDWRDTLERRPVDLSEPAVTARLTEATENVLAAAPALMDEKFSIDRNDWFERGELPQVGEFVDVEGEDLVYGDGELNCEVIAHVEDTAVIRMSYGLGCFQKHVLSPSRTERDKAIDGMKQYCPYPGSWDTVGRIYAEALYDAGYRKQNLPAK